MKIFIVLNILIALVIILRALAQGHISKRAQYAMWISIPVYLLISVFAFQAIAISVPKKVKNAVSPTTYIGMPNREIAESNNYLSGHPISNEDTLFIEPASNAHEASEQTAVNPPSTAAVERTSEQSVQNTGKPLEIKDILKLVALTGSILTALFILINNVFFMGKIRMSRSYYGRSPYGNMRVYRVNHAGSPFLFGKDIYINRNLNENTDAYRFAVCHEYCHHKQGDSIWLLAEYIILCLFWYDPLVWYARKLMREDRELSVDERVLSIMGQENKAKYSMALLRFFKGITESDPLMNIATTMSNRNRPFIKRRIVNIMEGTRKSLAVTIAVSIILTAAVGCSIFKPSTNGKGEKVSADTPWYYCEGIECAREYENYDFLRGSLYQELIGKTDDGYVYEMRGEVATDDPESYNREMMNDLALYSETGELIAKMDLCTTFKETFPEEQVNVTLDRFVRLHIDDGQVKLLRKSKVDSMLKTYVIDIISGTITETESRALTIDFFDASMVYYTKCGNYEVYTTTMPLAFITYDSDGNRTDFSTVEESWRGYPYNASYIIPASDHQILMVNLENHSVWCYDIEAQTLTEIEENNDEFSWIYPYLLGSVHRVNQISYSSDGSLYFLTYSGIYRANFDNKTVDQIALFENFDINRNLVTTGGTNICNITEADSEQIKFTVYDVYKSGFSIYTATLADQNPNTGKTIITTDGYSETVFDAVYLFNSTDEDYFVKTVPYEYFDEDWSSDGSDQSVEIASMYANGEVGNQMLIDLMAGDCPDVVFYGTGFEQLNNGNCMLDLSEYYNSSDLKDSVFDNIVTACEKNGGLYNFPLNFWIYGIVVDGSIYDSDNIGMSYSDYYDFTHGYCNGTNVLANNQFRFMNTCIENNLDLFISNGTADFDCEAFREMAQYTRDNVNNIDMNDPELISTDFLRCFTSVNYHENWIGNLDHNNISYNNAKVIGYPSPDGRGVGALITESVSITKSASDPEGAWRFICMLCNPDIQRLESSPLSSSVGGGKFFPINREAFDLVTEDAVTDYNNEQSEFYYISNNHAEPPTIETNDFSTLKNAIESIDHIMSSDNDIEIIVYEEIQPYLCGDKTLDEVIEIINDRAQTVLDERA